MVPESLEESVKRICRDNGNDRTRLMDVVKAVQLEFGHVSSEAMDVIARELPCPRVEVEGVVTFYDFYSENPQGKIVIRLCNDVIDTLQGAEDVGKALTEALGIDFGETTGDGMFTLAHTACIGMCDQAPAALVNDVVVTSLTPEKARDLVAGLKADPDPSKLVTSFGDGNNSHELVKAMVNNNIRKRGAVLLADDHEDGNGLAKALEMSPEETIAYVKKSNLRGRGGACFPTGMKWEFTAKAQDDEKYILCNADEGEPGTFKDRVVLTEIPDLIFEGMTIGGYAIGAGQGIIYLRGEYWYLKDFLESVLEQRRSKNLLGKNILGKQGFDFDIRVQMGAGAYICGEETALIASCEGFRGDPKNRPPFPAQKGFLGKPTTVNNVETLACVTRIFEKGAEWFADMGTETTSGTKLLSVSGDVEAPGIYEVPFGTRISEVMSLAGAKDPGFAIVGGPSGQIIDPDRFERTICLSDVGTGGSFMVFDKTRDVLKIASSYMDFFIHESCGYCVPCRVGNVLLKERLQRIIEGKGEEGDIEYLVELGNTVKTASRCGLGQTSPNPILTSIERFRSVYEQALKPRSKEGFQPSFDIRAALSDAEDIAERKSVHFEE